MSTPLAAMAGPSRCWLAGARLLAATLALALPLVACNVNNPGIVPPERELNFPLVMTPSAPPSEGEAPEWLYVVNTNYNFRFNSGSLMSFDLAEVSRALHRSCLPRFTEKVCEDQGGEYDDQADCCEVDGVCVEQANEAEEVRAACEDDGGEYDADEDRCCLACRDVERDILCDGRDDVAYQACCYDDLRERGRTFVPDGGEVRIQSFVSGIALSSSGERLYMSVRGNDSLLWVDVDGGQLECGQGGNRLCSGERYVGVKTPLETTEAQFSPLPLALAVGSAADFGLNGDVELIFTGHDDGSVSFLVDAGGGPGLRASLGPLNGRINSMRLDPESGLVYVAQQPGSEIARVGATRIGGRLAPFQTSPLRLTGLVDNTFVRDMAFVPADASRPDDASRVHALVRGTNSVVRSLYFLELDPNDTNEARTVDAARVGVGPARLQQAEVAGGRYLFVSCYDDRSIYIFDADTRQLVAFVRGLLGPYEFVIDGARELAYIADFASSTVRVVDLRGLANPAQVKPRIVLTLGQPDLEESTL